MNNPTERNEQVDAAMKALDCQLAKARRHVGPDTTAIDELRSAGHEAITNALRDFDPELGVPWGAYVTQRIKYAFMTLARDHNRRAAAGRVPRSLSATNTDGDEYPLPADPRAADPCEIAAARETLGRGECGASRGPKFLPAALAPADAARRAARLRDAMFRPIREDDMEAVMMGVVERAKKGDPRSVKLLIDLVTVRAAERVVIVDRNDLT